MAYPDPGQWCGGANSGACIAWQLSAGKIGPGKKGGLNSWWNQTQGREEVNDIILRMSYQVVKPSEQSLKGDV